MVVVRPVRDDETDAAGDVVLGAYLALPEGPSVAGHPYGQELRDVASRAKETVVLVAVDEVDGAGDGGDAGGSEAILGCVTYVPDEASPFAEDLRPGEAGMRMLAVAPDAQGRGVGRALVEACVERARRDGKERLFLHSGTWMRAAHRLYESLGFERRPSRDWEPELGIPLLAYALELEGGAAGRQE